MSKLSQAVIEQAIQQFVDPYLKQDLVTAHAVKNIDIGDDTVTVSVVLPYPAKGFEARLRQQIEEAIACVAAGMTLNLTIDTEILARSVQRGTTLLDGVKNIIAVASGKGGVGKSTTSVNLALALAREGASVGVLDADIYGPSQPRMLGIAGRPESKDGKTMEPLENYGIQSMSIGYLIDEDSPMIWRGPMVTQALEQLLRETNWHDLDYLVIDLPPGTGDVQLTLSQKIPVSGAIIVTTPQDIALLDARKGLKMFEKVDVDVLGIVENMSTHVCSQCGHEEHVFGTGGAARMAEDYDVELLGALPLDISIREHVDSGEPSVVAEPEGKVAQVYIEIARRVAAKLALKSKDYSHKFPNIVIQNT